MAGWKAAGRECKCNLMLASQNAWREAHKAGSMRHLLRHSSPGVKHANNGAQAVSSADSGQAWQGRKGNSSKKPGEVSRQEMHSSQGWANMRPGAWLAAGTVRMAAAPWHARG